ncbi:MAG: efflux RND transporter periplasmic adaptor subunit [Gemmatimonadetes bacterium]|nr:efflux RND transporter periplasmic adaptor subunit [Gemmatimonadota bacterium]MYK67636.1 efflux RND transporter periplasmic adaptor subunit [Gemmatimonadota bacterium]
MTRKQSGNGVKEIVSRRMDVATARVLLLAGIAGGVAACGGAQGEPPEEVADRGDGYRRVVNVEVQRVETTNFTSTIPLTGVALAMRDVMVSAEEAGVVRRVLRDKGSPVRAGNAILRLDDTILRAQVRTATAKAEYDDEVWERRRKLYEEDGIGSEVAYHEARATAEQSRGNLEALQARLDRTTIRAPIRGTLNDRLVEVGTMVSPGTVVARVVQADTIRIMSGVPERYALHVAVGADASVSFDVLPGEVFAGSMTYVGAVVDLDARTFPVELTLPNPGGRIKPGMVADVSVTQGEMAAAIVVPRQALVSMEDGQVVFVAEEAGGETVAVARRLEVAASQGNDVVIGSGLAPGDRLVVVGQQGLTDGDRVRVVAGEGGAS